MKFSFLKLGLMAVSLLVLASWTITKTNKTNTPNLADKTLPGASVLAFGPDNVLFVGDSKSGVVYAIPTKAASLKKPVHMNAFGIDKKIAKKLGVAPSDLIFNDMQIHPVSQEAYVAFKNGHAPGAKSMIAIINPTDYSVRFLTIDKNKVKQVSIKAPRQKHFKFYSVASHSLNITDIDYNDGYLYVAGLTNGEFASTLRKIKYPFTGKQTKVAGIEMYHAVHNQKETRAPIRTMTFEKVNGKSTLIAAYTCTPLVSIPTADIKAGKHIKAKTVAELGYGNTPIDMITFMAQEQDGSFDKKLLIVNKNRSASLISLKDFAKADKGEGLKTFTFGPTGVKVFPVPMAGVMHVSEQNKMMLSVLKRNIDTGSVDLISQLKGAYFRLSDFQSEYEFPDYKYKKGEPWKGFHNMVKPMEGYPELVREK